MSLFGLFHWLIYFAILLLLGFGFGLEFAGLFVLADLYITFKLTRIMSSAKMVSEVTISTDES